MIKKYKNNNKQQLQKKTMKIKINRNNQNIKKVKLLNNKKNN